MIKYVVQYACACVYYITSPISQTVHVVSYTSNTLRLDLTVEAGFESGDWAGSEACTSFSLACGDLITKEGLEVWLSVGT